MYDWEVNILPEQKDILIDMLIKLNFDIFPIFQDVYELLEPKYHDRFKRVIQ